MGRVICFAPRRQSKGRDSNRFWRITQGNSFLAEDERLMRNVIVVGLAGASLLIVMSLGRFQTEGTSTMNKQPRPLPGQQTVYPPATELEIRRFESEFDITLPPRYRSFLRTLNGGTFASCWLDTSNLKDGTVRPAPYGQCLQDLRTTSLPANAPHSLFHDDWLDIIREDDDVLVNIGSTEDGGYLFVYTTGEQADQVWLKTPDARFFDDKIYKSDWFLLGHNIDEFLKRLSYQPGK